ncbi:MAG: VWA domain-containing protein [Candidatus Wallbacteria bacterium]|nr:VWA domain-containing protein [Candidatus Wallbacteria bacterium]
MNRLLIVIALTLFTIYLQAQTISIHQVDTKDYPLVEVNFNVLDEDGKAREISGDDKLRLDLCSPIADYELKKYISSGHVLVLLDKSGSMRQEIRSLKLAVQYFVDILPDQFSMSLLAFDRDIKVLADFTQDKTFLKEAAEKLYAKGATAFYDSVYYGLESLRRMKDPFRFLIVLTDGVDQTYDGSPPLSRHSLNEVLQLIGESAIPVYTISLGDEADMEVLEQIAKVGNGFHYHMPRGSDLSGLYKKLAENLAREYNLRFFSPYLVYDGRTLTMGMELSKSDGDYHASRQFKVPNLEDGQFFNYQRVMPTEHKGEQGVKIIVSDADGHPINGYFQVLVNGQVVSKGKVEKGEGDFTLEQHEANRNFTAFSDQKAVRERPAVKPSRLYLYTITKDNTFVPMEVKLKGRYNRRHYIFNSTADGLGENQRLADISPGEYIAEIGENGQVLMYSTLEVSATMPLVEKYTFSRIVVAYDGMELPPALKMGLCINIRERRQDKFVLKGKRLFYFVGNDSSGLLPPGDYEITITDAMSSDKTVLHTELRYTCVTFGNEEIYTNIPRNKVTINK